MDCQKVVKMYENLFFRIKKLNPYKDDTIFIKVENCLINITRKRNQLFITHAKLIDRKGEMMVLFSDFSGLENVLSAKDVLEYGERLLYAVLDHKVILDPGNLEKATQSGFYKLVSRSKFKKNILIFELTIPVM